MVCHARTARPPSPLYPLHHTPMTAVAKEDGMGEKGHCRSAIEVTGSSWPLRCILLAIKVVTFWLPGRGLLLALVCRPLSYIHAGE